MRTQGFLSFLHSSRILLFLAFAAGLAGCGKSDETGTLVKPGEGEIRANKNMEDFMKSQAAKGQPAKAPAK